MARLSVWVLLGLALFTVSVHDLGVRAETPTEYECRPYIEKALQDLRTETDTVLSKEEDVTTEEPSSQESPIDVTSQEEDENTAAEETSIEEDVPASPEQPTASEEVQEALFDNSTEQPEEASEENVEEDGDEDEEDDEEAEEVTASEEEANATEEEVTASEEEVTASEEEVAASEEEVTASEEEVTVSEEKVTASEEDEVQTDSQQEADDDDQEATSADAEDEDEAEAASDEATDDDDDNAASSEAEDDDEEQTGSQEAADEEEDDEEQGTESQEAQTASEEDAEDDDEEETTDSQEPQTDEDDEEPQTTESLETQTASEEATDEDNEEDGDDDDDNDKENEAASAEASAQDDDDDDDDDKKTGDDVDDEDDKEVDDNETDDNQDEDITSQEDDEVDTESSAVTAQDDDDEDDDEEQTQSTEEGDDDQEEAATLSEEAEEAVSGGEDEYDDDTTPSEEEEEDAEAGDDEQPSVEEEAEADDSAEPAEATEASPEETEEPAADSEEEVSAEAVEETSEEAVVEVITSDEEDQPTEEVSEEVVTESTEEEVAAASAEVSDENVTEEVVSGESVVGEEASEEVVAKVEAVSDEATPVSQEEAVPEEIAVESEPYPEEDLLLEYEIPSNLRDTSHIYELLNVNDEAAEKENALHKVADVILRDLKKTYDNAIKPLEALYKYRDLSNRHFGDPEIFSKPLVLFMGPWSGGKSTILNYLTQNEYTPNSVRTGAEPSPAYFNILMHGDEPEVLDGTQLAADWTFSGLQKFGQGLLDRLRGQKLPNKLLERVNIVEIPGILEVRKQVSQYFPFNDACQWFIDRADIIFLVYDPSKLDVGPETEAILDQLKGREYQTRILLNKADQVKPEELLRVQGALIWNISPLMSSAQPPVMYTVSLWSNPFETGAPIRLLQAQERSLLLDLGQAIDKRIENKIASARRFAVRVRNHAKMVDCYLTTYYNHKTLFANKKHISEQIIGNPQQYHIYEGLSTLTNISRYDLPDPESYRDFFHLNPLYEFKKLSETCTYFRGCPINKLDIAIAYDLPELVGKYKKLAEAALEKLRVPSSTTDFGRGKSSS